MKKSEMFRKAQLAVVNSLTLTGEEKLEILSVLKSEENLAIFIEGEKEKREKKQLCELASDYPALEKPEDLDKCY